jgi:hypothetical protein
MTSALPFCEFVIKNLDGLRNLGKKNWWSFNQDDTWMVKGQAIVGETSSYSLLMTDFSNVYYSSAGTTQIIKELTVKLR